MRVDLEVETGWNLSYDHVGRSSEHDAFAVAKVDREFSGVESLILNDRSGRRHSRSNHDETDDQSGRQQPTEMLHVLLRPRLLNGDGGIQPERPSRTKGWQHEITGWLTPVFSCGEDHARMGRSRPIVRRPDPGRRSSAAGRQPPRWRRRTGTTRARVWLHVRRAPHILLPRL